MFLLSKCTPAVAWGTSLIRAYSAQASTFQQQVSQAFQTAITSSVCQHLEAKGYVVIDNLFHPSLLADALRGEIVRLFKEGHMHKNSTHLVRQNQTQLLEKSHIYEAELTFDQNIQELAPLCSHMNLDRTMATMLSLHLPVRLDAQAIKLQYNAGQGGCFPMHLDTDALIDGRTITAIFYLNPRWQPERGGQLRVYPWPLPAVDIEPTHNRLVLFSSARLLHRVMPTNAPCTAQSDEEDSNRCCFTIWLSQDRGRRRSAPPPSLSALQPTDPSDTQAAVQFLMSPFVRPHVMKLAYAQEWEESLQQSHSPGPALTSLLEQHRAEVALISKALSAYSNLIQDVTANTDLARTAAGRMRWF